MSKYTLPLQISSKDDGSGYELEGDGKHHWSWP